MANLEGIDWKQKLEDATLTTPPASDAEALAKTKNDVALTPENLAAMGSTATFAGLVELATNAESLVGTDSSRAITPDDLKYVANMRDILSFSGHNLAGACTLTGVKVGDVVLTVTGLAAGTVGDKSSSFESTITVADQIQQIAASDLSSNVYLAYIQRKS